VSKCGAQMVKSISLIFVISMHENIAPVAVGTQLAKLVRIQDWVKSWSYGMLMMRSNKIIKLIKSRLWQSKS
jgi:hypothetical protein